MRALSATLLRECFGIEVLSTHTCNVRDGAARRLQALYLLFLTIPFINELAESDLEKRGP